MPLGPLPSPIAGSDVPVDVEDWATALERLLDGPPPEGGYLPQAEAAERACPGDPIILCLAATAALLDGRADRAQLYLKRYTKRFEATATHHLLSALALGLQNKLSPARWLLERHGLTELRVAMQVFPAGWEQTRWLRALVDKIMGRERPVRGRKPAVKNSAKPAAKSGGNPAAGASRAPSAVGPKSARSKPLGVKPGAEVGAGGTPSTPAVASSPNPALERLPVDMPLVVNLELQPLLDAAGRPAESDGGWFRLRRQLSHLSLAQGFDELLCLPYLKGIETFWYQTETVRKVLKQFHGRVLLADEVGLGKTVEAGMVLKEYLMRGMAERVLVLVPAALVGQWREELETKFDIPCATTQDPLLREDPERFWAAPRIVASLALARRREHAERLLAQPFDLVIVDEAHHLRDRASQSYRLVDGLTKRFLLLLSATPVQNNLIELYNLLTLLKPGIFKTQKEFRAAYMTAGKPRLPANPARLRELMRDAMIRNTRAVVALKLPRRHAATRRIIAAPEEQAAYQALATATRALAAGGGESRHRLALRHLLAAAGSSPAAGAAATARFAARVGGDGVWRRLAERWAALGVGGKETALLDLLAHNPTEKKLVFIHHRETMASVAGLLARHDIAFARFDGSLSGPEKDAAIDAFRDRVPVLLCSESGGEGRNIQFCNTLINFDVPWNPMAIEQRIGRVDRIGQTREVFVFNLVTSGTVEEEVLRLLDEKINMFELVIGETGAILGELDEERDFAELVLDAWLEASEAGRVEAFDAIGRRLDTARTQYGDAKALDDALFGEDFETA